MLLFRFSLAAGLIAATVVIQALFMSVGINTFKRIEKRGHASRACYHHSDMDALSSNSD